MMGVSGVTGMAGGIPTQGRQVDIQPLLTGAMAATSGQPVGAQAEGPQASGMPAQAGGAPGGGVPAQTDGMPAQADGMPGGGVPAQAGGMPAQAGGTPGGGMQAQSGGAPAQSGAGQTAFQPRGQATAQTAPQPFFRASVPKGFSMTPGQTMWGTITDRQGGSFTLRMGDYTLSARSNLPLSTGQNIQLTFNGIRGGQIELQLMRTSPFSRMSDADLSTALNQINVPADGKSVNVAKGMVEFGIPLTSQNFNEVSKALAQLPRPATMTDMAACSLLKDFKMPMTPGNITTMSDFIARNPMLGAQLFELQYCFDKDIKKSKDSSKEMLNMIEETTESINGLTVSPKKQSPQGMGKNLKRLARESGIERTEYRGGLRDSEDEWELVMLNRRLGKMVEKEDTGKGTVLRNALNVVQNMQENLNAHQIINRGKPSSELAYYFIQIPLKLDNELVTVEARIKYYDEEEGRLVDPEDTRIEFDVTTERLGELHFDLKVKGGMINLDVGSQNEESLDFMEKFLPTLQENLLKTGYALKNFRNKSLEDFNRPPLVKREDFDTLEKVNVQA